MAADDPKYETMITLGADQPALLMSGDGVFGRLIFIHKGIHFDITGPMATTGEVRAVAEAVLKAAPA